MKQREVTYFIGALPFLVVRDYLPEDLFHKIDVSTFRNTVITTVILMDTSPTITTASDAASYKRLIWIELIGFDNTRPDVGVGDYLDNIGFTPYALSLLITQPDIIHHHNGLEECVEFPPDVCSYFGHEQNSERQRQVWTNHQLKQLVDEFHARGVKVMLATFTSWHFNDFEHEWVSDHQELFEKRRGGEVSNALLPLKRLKDGTLYEDFMIPKLCEVLQDYDFDIWHAADGWGPPRMALSEGDYSDDIFEQFVTAQQITVPQEIALKADDDAELCAKRADWVWNNHRRQWFDFYGDRWGSFFTKKIAAVHAIGKEVFINSTWTRDPLEAIYRYGIDYRKIAAAGIDGIVTESAAGAGDLEAEPGAPINLYNYTATLMLIKAYVPEVPLYFLHGVKDTKEQWDLIHHAPTVLESEIYSLTNVFYNTPEGKRERCAAGFVICLGDAIEREEWQWLEKRWNVAFTPTPKRLMGATLIWSDSAFSTELDDFIAKRDAISHNLLYSLNEQGAPIQTAVRLEDLGAATGCVLLLNAHNYTAPQLASVLEYKNGPIIMIGRENSALPQPDIKFAAGAAQEELYCYVWNLDAETSAAFTAWQAEQASAESSSEGILPLDHTAIVEPFYFVYPLAMQKVPLSFIDTCAQLVSMASSPLRFTTHDTFVNMQGSLLPNGKLRILLRNKRLSYSSPIIEVGAPIESVEIKTPFPCAKLTPNGSQIQVKIPGRGATVVEIELAGSRSLK
jgi:hypothetical protein